MNLAFVGHELQLGFVVYLTDCGHAGLASSFGLQMRSQTLAYRRERGSAACRAGSACSSAGRYTANGPSDRGLFVAVVGV